jgi:DNA-binding winged helix-turn-helix (wHTH) protein
MRAVQSEIFAFGDFVLVPKERLLLRGGEPIALTAKAFDLLVVLVRRADIWPPRTSCSRRYGPARSCRRPI